MRLGDIGGEVGGEYGGVGIGVGLNDNDGDFFCFEGYCFWLIGVLGEIEGEVECGLILELDFDWCFIVLLLFRFSVFVLLKLKLSSLVKEELVWLFLGLRDEVFCGMWGFFVEWLDGWGLILIDISEFIWGVFGVFGRFCVCWDCFGFNMILFLVIICCEVGWMKDGEGKVCEVFFLFVD